MKKNIFLILTILYACGCYAQTTGYLRNDTVKITNAAKNATLVLETASKGHGWYLKDIGNGRTQFVQAEIPDIFGLQDSLSKKINKQDSSLFATRYFVTHNGSQSNVFGNGLTGIGDTVSVGGKLSKNLKLNISGHSFEISDTTTQAFTPKILLSNGSLTLSNVQDSGIATGWNSSFVIDGGQFRGFSNDDSGNLSQFIVNPASSVLYTQNNSGQMEFSIDQSIGLQFINQISHTAPFFHSSIDTATFSAKSVVDKEWVLARIAGYNHGNGSESYTFESGINQTSGVVKLGGNLTDNVNMPLNDHKLQIGETYGAPSVALTQNSTGHVQRALITSLSDSVGHGGYFYVDTANVSQSILSRTNNTTYYMSANDLLWQSNNTGNNKNVSFYLNSDSSGKAPTLTDKVFKIGLSVSGIDTTKFTDSTLVPKRWVLDKIAEHSFGESADSSVFATKYWANSKVTELLNSSNFWGGNEFFFGSVNFYGDVSYVNSTIYNYGRSENLYFGANSLDFSRVADSNPVVTFNKASGGTNLLAEFKLGGEDVTTIDINGNIEITNSTAGLILKDSVTGSRYMLGVASGVITATAL